MANQSVVPLSTKLEPADCAIRVAGNSLKNKSVLITGGASGLGAGIGLQYAQRGAYVTLADINEDLGTQYAESLRAKGLRVQFIKADVVSWADQIAAFKAAIAFSPSKSSLDIVVSAAGVFGDPFLGADEPVVSLESDPPAPNIAAFEINTIGSYYTAKLAQLYFKLPGGQPSTEPKSLILIASLAAYFDIPVMSSYTGSKFGVRGIFRNIRPLFADRGMRVNLIAPWIIDTPLVVAWLAMFKAVGAPVGDIEQVYTAALRFADDPAINGRAFAIGPKQILDLGDDAAGEDAGKVMSRFYDTETPGWHKMAAEMKSMMGV